MKEEELRQIDNTELLEVYVLINEFLDNLETLKKKAEEENNEG